jgi:hypothetical protein
MAHISGFLLEPFTTESAVRIVRAITVGDELVVRAHAGSTVTSSASLLGRWSPPRVSGPGPTVEVVMSEPTVDRSTTVVQYQPSSCSPTTSARRWWDLAGYSGKQRCSSSRPRLWFRRRGSGS